ncbi:u3 small nucleolar RNA-associated protein 10, partial [Moniliophthora roreri]
SVPEINREGINLYKDDQANIISTYQRVLSGSTTVFVSEVVRASLSDEDRENWGIVWADFRQIRVLERLFCKEYTSFECFGHPVAL